jgi:hypothetical protein
MDVLWMQRLARVVQECREAATATAKALEDWHKLSFEEPRDVADIEAARAKFEAAESAERIALSTVFVVAERLLKLCPLDEPAPVEQGPAAGSTP